MTLTKYGFQKLCYSRLKSKRSYNTLIDLFTRFPTVEDLGHASWDDVAPYWAGFGYYARASELTQSRGYCCTAGTFSKQSLSSGSNYLGIGPSTAGALMSSGFTTIWRDYGRQRQASIVSLFCY